MNWSEINADVIHCSFCDISENAFLPLLHPSFANNNKNVPSVNKLNKRTVKHLSFCTSLFAVQISPTIENILIQVHYKLIGRWGQTPISNTLLNWKCQVYNSIGHFGVILIVEFPLRMGIFNVWITNWIRKKRKRNLRKIGNHFLKIFLQFVFELKFHNVRFAYEIERCQSRNILTP